MEIVKSVIDVDVDAKRRVNVDVVDVVDVVEVVDVVDVDVVIDENISRQDEAKKNLNAHSSKVRIKYFVTKTRSFCRNSFFFFGNYGI